MPSVTLNIVLLVLLLVQCSTGELSVGFSKLVHRVEENQRQVAVNISKIGENKEEIVVLLIPLSFEEYYSSVGQLPIELNDMDLPDPAEYDVSGKKDFIRNGALKHVFGPSSDDEIETIMVHFNDDSVNEADEGFLLLLKLDQSPKEVSSLGNGVSMIIIEDDDSVMFSFEEPHYEVQEEDMLMDDLVYVTKNGQQSEQLLRVLVTSPYGSASNGEDFEMDSFIELNFHPDEERKGVHFRILDDVVPEESESFELELSTSTSDDQPRVTIGLDITIVGIVDNDFVTIGFLESSYSASESDGIVEVCVGILSPSELDLTVIATLGTRDGTAKVGEDYLPTKLFVNLPDYNERTSLCYKIPLVDDKEKEPTETFIISIEREISTPPNAIFEPSEVEAWIIDNDIVDECVSGTHNCHQNAACVDTVQRFHCVCINGFTGNGIQCEDIDECSDSDLNDCDPIALCTNTPGAYTCSCPSGYTGNGRECHKIIVDNKPPPHECQSNSDCISFAECNTRAKVHRCICRSGYKGNGKLCEEINECTDPVYGHRCPTQSRCINTPGTYFCKCNPGYRTHGRNQCRDYDECKTYYHNCDQHASCTNTIGSFQCTCKPGYRGSGVRGDCTEI